MSKPNFHIYYFKINLLLFFYLFIFKINASNVVSLTNDNLGQSIESSLLIYQDSTNLLTFNEISTKEFSFSKSNVPNYGFSNSTFWIKISVRNLSDESEFMLNLSLPILDNVNFYHPTSKSGYKVIKSGEKYPFNHRQYKDPNFLFDMSVPNNSVRIFYIQVSSEDAIQLPISIGTKKAVLNQIKKKDILSGIYLGVMLVMILYNLFIYFSVKDKSYIYYVIYITLVLLTQTIIQGYPFQYLWPNYPVLSQYSFFIVPSLVGLASLAFMNIFLKVKDYNPKLYKISFYIIIPYIISMGLAVFGNFKFSLPIMEFSAGLVSIFILFTCVTIIRKNHYQPAKYFLAAWVVFLAGVVIYILKDFEVLPFNNFTRYTMQIGSAIETVLLSLALASRINLYKKERLIALEEKEKIVLEQNIILEQKVIERTSALNNTLYELKETQSQLVNAEKMSSLGQLTAGIAHEINNPINFVSSNIPPLKQDLDDVNTILKKYEEITPDNIISKLEEIEILKKELDFEYLKTELPTIINGIEDGAKRTQEIVSGLRNFSRLDEFELQLARVNEGIESTIVLIKNKLNKIKLIKNLQTIPNIECYPGKLNQLFMNIIDNAIGAIEEKKSEKNGEINISTSSDANFVYIKVKDNGIGMNDNSKAKMFEPFFTTKPVGSGTGLGLSIVYTILKTHKGEIEVVSEENIGTEITVKLPIKQ